MTASRRFAFALVLLAALPAGARAGSAAERIEVAQAQPQAGTTPAPSPTPSASAAPAGESQPAAIEPIGNVATVTGIATVIRDRNSYPLRVRDDVYLNDIVQTSSNSSLGITFDDATTFNLSAGSKITIDTYVYEDGGKQNSAIFDIGKGTVAFVAAAVARTGNMKITTPTATLGIRGTTGVVDVPDGAAANRAGNVSIKLYPDADGRVGHIDVDDRSSGARLGALTRGASGFAIRPGAGGPAGMRFAAVPIAIPTQQTARDRAYVAQVHLAQTTGRQIVAEQRDFRRANPAAISRIPRPSQPPQQQLRPATPPNQQPQRPNRQPGLDNRGGPQQPGTPNRQGARQPAQRQGQSGAGQPSAPRAGQSGPQRGVGRAAEAPASNLRAQPGIVAPQPAGRAPTRPGAVAPPPPRAGLPAGPPPAIQQPRLQRPGVMPLRQSTPLRRVAPRKPAPAPKDETERR